MFLAEKPNKWEEERREWARGGKADRRRIQERQWMRKKRAFLKQSTGTPVNIYFPTYLIQRIEKFRAKGEMRSKVIVELIKVGLNIREGEKRRQEAGEAGLN